MKKINMNRPLIVAAIDGSEDVVRSAKMAKKMGANLLEARIDLFSSKDIKNIGALLSKMKKTAGMPIIATVRGSKEQGLTAGTRHTAHLKDPERKDLLEKVLPFADILDIELASDSINSGIIKLAHKIKKIVILSCHDFKSMPSKKRVNALFRKFKSLGGDIFKIAATPKTPSDVNNFLATCLSLKGTARIFIAMGEIGTPSRIAGFSCGSCMTYGYVNKPTAPGQLSVKELSDYCSLFYSARK